MANSEEIKRKLDEMIGTKVIDIPIKDLIKNKVGPSLPETMTEEEKYVYCEDLAKNSSPLVLGLGKSMGKLLTDPRSGVSLLKNYEINSNINALTKAVLTQQVALSGQGEELKKTFINTLSTVGLGIELPDSFFSFIQYDRFNNKGNIRGWKKKI